MNMKQFLLLVSAPIWVPILMSVLLIVAPILLFLPLSDAECLESGIIPARRRNDRDFVARIRARATGGEG